MVRMSDLNKESYKTGEVAKFLGVSTRTVQNYCQDGVLKDVIGVKGRRQIMKEDLIEYLGRAGLLVDDSADNRHDAIYAKVMNYDQSEDLSDQIVKLKVLASTQNPKKLKVYSDMKCGGIKECEQLRELLNDVMDQKVDRVYAIDKNIIDDQTGISYIQFIFDKCGTELVEMESDYS